MDLSDLEQLAGVGWHPSWLENVRSGKMDLAWRPILTLRSRLRVGLDDLPPDGPERSEALASLQLIAAEIVARRQRSRAAQHRVRARKKLLQPGSRVCESCGSAVEKTSHARRRFCSNACRVAAHRASHRQPE